MEAYLPCTEKVGVRFSDPPPFSYKCFDCNWYKDTPEHQIGCETGRKEQRMVRSYYDEEVDKDIELEEFSQEWVEQVIQDLENANWHDALEAFGPLIMLLPALYKKVSSDIFFVTRLNEAIRAWDRYF